MSYTSSDEFRINEDNYVASTENKSILDQGDNVSYRNTPRETLLNWRADPQIVDIPGALSGTEALNIHWETLQLKMYFISISHMEGFGNTLYWQLKPPQKYLARKSHFGVKTDGN